MNTYPSGSNVLLRAAFTANGINADPDEVFFSLIDPAGIRTDYTYGTDAQIARDETGLYRVNVSLDKSGIYAYRFHSSGANQSANEGQFYSGPSPFA